MVVLIGIVMQVQIVSADGDLFFGAWSDGGIAVVLRADPIRMGGFHLLSDIGRHIFQVVDVVVGKP